MLFPSVGLDPHTSKAQRYVCGGGGRGGGLIEGDRAHVSERAHVWVREREMNVGGFQSVEGERERGIECEEGFLKSFRSELANHQRKM